MKTDRMLNLFNVNISVTVQSFKNHGNSAFLYMPNENLKDVLLPTSKISSLVLSPKENLFSAEDLKVADWKCEEWELLPINFISLSFYVDRWCLVKIFLSLIGFMSYYSPSLLIKSKFWYFGDTKFEWQIWNDFFFFVIQKISFKVKEFQNLLQNLMPVGRNLSEQYKTE